MTPRRDPAGAGPEARSARRPLRAGGVPGALVVLLAVLAVYGPTLGFEFVYDDHAQIERNPWLHGSDGLGRLFTGPFWGFLRPAGELVSNYYRPLFGVLYWSIAQAGGPVPAPYHAASVLLHAAVCWLAMALAHRLAPAPRAPAAALGSGLLFALHPAQAETVSWVAAQADLLCSILALGGLLVHLGRRDAPSPAWRPALGALAFLGACLAKETGVALLLVVGVVELLPRRGETVSARLRAGAPRVAPYLLALATYAVLRQMALEGLAPRGGASVVEGIGRAASLVAEYARFLVAPFPQRLLTPAHVPASLASVPALLGGLLVAAAGWTIWRRREDPEIAVPLAILVAFLLPVAAAGALADTRPHPIFAERYLYLPAAGFCLLCGGFVSREVARAPRRRAVASAVAAGVLVASGAIARTRSAAYRDDLALFRGAVAGSPASATARNNLGAALAARGAIPEAISQYRAAIELDPAAVEAWVNLAAAHEHAGDVAAALAAYQEALRRAPHEPTAAVGLARLHQKSGNPAAGADLLDALLAATGGSYELWVERAWLHLDAGASDAAIPLLERAVEALPTPPRAWYLLAQARYNRGELDAAQRAAGSAIARGSGPGPHRLLAMIAARRGDRAVARRHLEEAIRRFPEDRQAHDLLAALGAE